MLYTNYLGLKKPETHDYANINDLNDNFESIDTAIENLQQATPQKPQENSNEKTVFEFCIESMEDLMQNGSFFEKYTGEPSSVITDKKIDAVAVSDGSSPATIFEVSSFIEETYMAAFQANICGYVFNTNDNPVSFFTGELSQITPIDATYPAFMLLIAYGEGEDVSDKDAGIFSFGDMTGCTTKFIEYTQIPIQCLPVKTHKIAIPSSAWSGTSATISVNGASADSAFICTFDNPSVFFDIANNSTDGSMAFGVVGSAPSTDVNAHILEVRG